MKVFISQPMAGMTEEEIRNNRAEVVKELETSGYEVVDSVFSDFNTSTVKNVSLSYLAKSLDLIAQEADVVYFMKGWENARGCKLEQAACLAYGVKAIYQ